MEHTPKQTYKKIRKDHKRIECQGEKKEEGGGEGKKGGGDGGGGEEAPGEKQD